MHGHCDGTMPMADGERRGQECPSAGRGWGHNYRYGRICGIGVQAGDPFCIFADHASCAGRCGHRRQDRGES